MADLEAIFGQIVDGLRAHSRLNEVPIGDDMDAETAIWTYYRGPLDFKETMVLCSRVNDYLLEHGHEIVDGW